MSFFLFFLSCFFFKAIPLLLHRLILPLHQPTHLFYFFFLSFLIFSLLLLLLILLLLPTHLFYFFFLSFLVFPLLLPLPILHLLHLLHRLLLNHHYLPRPILLHLIFWQYYFDYLKFFPCLHLQIYSTHHLIYCLMVILI